MTRHHFFVATFAAVAIMIGTAPSRADENSVKDATSLAFDGYIKGMNSKNADNAVSVFHSESPELKDTREALKQVFDVYELALARKSFTFLGTDGTYATARLSYATLKVKGPEFRNNTADHIWIFKKEGSEWKVFHTVLLATEFHDK